MDFKKHLEELGIYVEPITEEHKKKLHKRFEKLRQELPYFNNRDIIRKRNLWE